MIQTLSLLVKNNSGVLTRVAGLFARRGYNIESLAVGVTNNHNISRITIVVDGDEQAITEVETQLGKLSDVMMLKRLVLGTYQTRELMLVKVESTPRTRADIIEVARVMEAKICDISSTTITIEISDTTERIEITLELLKIYNILEIVRTGAVAMQKGTEVLKPPTN
ncbi:MAG: acetolactate synthase small subunit [Oscillospiraceae bacterium]